jgi:hypothetical protein
MKRVFQVQSPREQYHCDAAVVWCYDYRFDPGFRKFLGEAGVLNFDSIQIAGGAKSLASPEGERDREFVLEQIRKSRRLRGTNRVILMVHSDCGAYGGLKAAFGGDARVESAYHERELRRAAAVILAELEGVSVEGYFADFEGVWKPEGGAGPEASS